MSNSITRQPSLTLALRFNEKAAELLTDFANMRPESFDSFETKWWEKTGRGWYLGTGREVGAMQFLEVQTLVREIWEGKHRGNEGAIVEERLSLLRPRQEEGWYDTSQQMFRVQWEEGLVWA